MLQDDGLWVRIVAALLGSLPWLLGCVAGLIVVSVRRARLGPAGTLAIGGFVVLLVSAVFGIVIGGYLQSAAVRTEYDLTAAAYAMLFGGVSLLKSLFDATGLVLIAIAVVRGRGGRDAPASEPQA